LFKNCTSCAVFNTGFEHSPKPIIWSFNAHPCAEHKDKAKECTSCTFFGRILKGSALKRYLENGMGFREGKKLLVEKVSSLP